MKANIEIKARCADLTRARENAERIATSHLGVDRQTDTYFVTSQGRLKLRESSLSGGQLVPYLRPDTPGPKRSDYQVISVEDAPGLRRLLGEILGVHCVVRKEREIFLCENVRIHLDRVEGLGEFVELEAVFDGAGPQERAERDKVDGLMRELGVREEDLLAHSYESMLSG